MAKSPYTPEFKLSAVEEYLNGSASYEAVAMRNADAKPLFHSDRAFSIPAVYLSCG